jgi:hypothetical protein
MRPSADPARAVRAPTPTLVVASLAAALAVTSCRLQTTAPTTVPADGRGNFTAQCSGDFPDWISSNPPPASGDVNGQEPGIQQSFQLAQSYPLGNPVFATGPDGIPRVDHWTPLAADVDAPWRAYANLSDATQRSNYLAALKTYVLQGMSDPGIDFDATKNNQRLGARRWFHVPMMTAAGDRRREPYHGVTSERGLRAGEQVHWLTAGPNLKAVAIGYYNLLGGYTIGQVFNNYDLTRTDPTSAHFIDGTLVFKLLFAQYDPSRIVAPDPLLHSPAWFVQDPANPTAPLMQVRLLQVDIAVKDDHVASTTGWVFATYVYDESLVATEPNAWRRLTPVGLQWGNDPTVTATAVSPLAETWINPALPAAFRDHLGRGGRLIGPVDNPVSSCISCHSTAEVDMAQAGNAIPFLGAAMIPPASCSPAEQMGWFRNLPSGAGGSQPFGRAVSACPLDTSATGLTPVDYSLQLQEGLQSVFGFRNGNPCADWAKAQHDAAGDPESTQRAAPMAQADLAARVPPGEPALRMHPREITQVLVKQPEPALAASASELHRR